MTNQENIANQENMTDQENIANQENMTNQENIANQENMTDQENIANQENMTDQENIANRQNNLDYCEISALDNAATETGDEQERVQKKTFVNWINSYLSKSPVNPSSRPNFLSPPHLQFVTGIHNEVVTLNDRFRGDVDTRGRNKHIAPGDDPDMHQAPGSTHT
uniref:Uncharacterized protein n=1 Tax=Timema cristinae TaxID=61476 RepID=A0A7R9CEJ7_TIMCR|nr:unnamed protein product [Timema cristinae]